MKHLTIAALVALSTSAAFAAPFSYQQQVGSVLDPSIQEGPALTAQLFAVSNLNPSEFKLFEGVDIDGSALFAYEGQVVPSVSSGPSSYEQIMDY
jgi:hypothetical protein